MGDKKKRLKLDSETELWIVCESKYLELISKSDNYWKNFLKMRLKGQHCDKIWMLWDKKLKLFGKIYI